MLSRMQLNRWIAIAVLLVPVTSRAQDVDPGRRTFEERCGRCHGGDGNGAEMGPPIRERLRARDN